MAIFAAFGAAAGVVARQVAYEVAWSTFVNVAVSAVNQISGHAGRAGRSVASSTDIRVSGKMTDTASPALRDFRRDLNRTVAKALREAAEDHVLPTAKRKAPSFIAPTLVIRGGRRPRLTTTARGKRRQVVGLLEFGGTVRTELKPRRAQALRLRNGLIVARVRAPRTYRPKRFMRDALESEADRVARHVRDELVKDLNRRLGNGRRGGGRLDRWR